MKTVWTHKEAKWKPRNLQAALICRKAREIFMPPPEPIPVPPPKPTAEQLATQLAQRKAELKRDKEAHERKTREAVKQSNAAFREKRKELPLKNMWAARYVRQLCKSEGRIAPTTKEQQCLRASPNPLLAIQQFMKLQPRR